MKTQKFLTLFVLLFFILGILTTSVYAGPPQPEKDQPSENEPLHISLSAPRSGIENIGASTLQSVTPTDVPIGIPFEICFGFFVQSPDAEYGDYVDVDLPDNWLVNSIAPNSAPVANGCSAALPPVSGINSGNVLYWQSTGYPPQTGCGAWNGSSTGLLFNFCANVTIPDVSGAPWSVPWNYVGDGYGSEPHSTSGSFGPIDPVQPLMLIPETFHTTGCPQEYQTKTFTAQNSTETSMHVNFDYYITSGTGTCGGLSYIDVPAYSSTDFDVSFEAKNSVGSTFMCDIIGVDSSNPANTDTSQIIKDIVSCYWDPNGWQLEPIDNATPNQWSAGVVGTNPAAVGSVGYVISGLGAGSNTINPDFQMFDPDTSTWTQLADLPNPRFSPVAGWIDGLLYVVGGYDVAFGATNDLQIFDPIVGTWDNITPLDMPNARGGGAGGVGTCSSGTGECLFHVGGGLDSQFANTTLETWEYNPSLPAWTQLDNKPAGLSADGHILGAGVSCGGKIFVGGDYRGYHHFFALDATQPSGSQWIQLANIPSSAGAMTPALVCDEESQSIYLIGGDPDGSWGTYNNTVYRYDISVDIWDDPMPFTLNVAQLGSVGWYMGNKLWSAGGTVGSGAISPLPFESLTYIECQLPPVADAGMDQSVFVNSMVTLDGSASYDPDNNLPLTYLWEQLTGPTVILDDPTAVSPTFTAPATTTTLEFSLIVTDNEGFDSIPDFVIVSVRLYEIFLPSVMK